MKPFTCRPVFISSLSLGLQIVLTLAPTLAYAAEPPQWWSTVSPPLISKGDNLPLAAAKVGQAKYMAKCALDTLNFIDPTLAAGISSNLVGAGKAIPTWTPPLAGSPQALSQSSPLLVGQLKAIAVPFYDALHATVPAWLDHPGQNDAEKGQLQLNQTKDLDPLHQDFYYPWTFSSSDDQNKAIATIGQLKAVFSLRFETLATAQADSDGDGMVDWKERRYFGTLAYGASDDFDGDGLTNGQELTLGSNLSDVDTDGDGIPDFYDGTPTGVNVVNFVASTLMVTSPRR